MKRLALVTSVLSAFAFSGCVAATDPGDQGVDPTLDSSVTPPADAGGVSWTRVTPSGVSRCSTSSRQKTTPGPVSLVPKLPSSLVPKLHFARAASNAWRSKMVPGTPCVTRATHHEPRPTHFPDSLPPRPHSPLARWRSHSPAFPRSAYAGLGSQRDHNAESVDRVAVTSRVNSFRVVFLGA